MAGRASALAAILLIALPAFAWAQDTATPEEGAAMVMTGALGRYPMSREASGTSWQPDAAPDEGLMSMSGGWMVMTHALLNGVWDSQGGPRGGEKTFAAGMLMVMADRPLADGSMVGLRAMLSPDPLMGSDGYPLLLQTGETADGSTPLVDRQHPHDLFMELAASYSHPVGDDGSVYLYAGLPGEPALGPPAFMHRTSGMDIPEAPLAHHWLDSTHITFGVVTAGVSRGPFKIEGSVFNGREPDQHRWNFETGPLKSWSLRASFNPTPNWSLQVSGGRLIGPEQLEPGVNQNRLTASAVYVRPIGEDSLVSVTAAWGFKDLDPGPALNAVLLEGELVLHDRWTLFGRAELAEENELLPQPSPVYTVGKITAGAIYDLKLAPHWKLGVGGLLSGYHIPSGLKPLYGSPTSGMAFVRLKLS